jgi:hypothetical protein
MQTICEQSTAYTIKGSNVPQVTGVGTPYNWVSATSGYLVTGSIPVDVSNPGFSCCNLLTGDTSFSAAWNCTGFPCRRQHLLCSPFLQSDCSPCAGGNPNPVCVVGSSNVSSGSSGFVASSSWDVPNGPFAYTRGNNDGNLPDYMSYGALGIAAGKTNVTIVYAQQLSGVTTARTYQYMSFGVANPAIGFSTGVSQPENIANTGMPTINQRIVGTGILNPSTGDSFPLLDSSGNTVYPPGVSTNPFVYVGNQYVQLFTSNGGDFPLVLNLQGNQGVSSQRSRTLAMATGTTVTYVGTQAYYFKPSDITAVSPLYIAVLALQQNLYTDTVVLQANQMAATLCGTAITGYRITTAIILSGDDTTLGMVYGVTCPAEGGDVFYLTIGKPQFTSVSQPSASIAPAYVAASTGADIRLWVETNSLVPQAAQFSFLNDGSCVAAGHPAGASGTSVQFGSVAIYCFQNSLYTQVQAPFTVTGASGFGTAVQFFQSDTQLAVGAPGSGTVYIFAFDPVNKQLRSTAPVHTLSGPTGVGYGSSLAFTSTWAAVAAPTTTTCGGVASTSGSVFVYANVTDCVLSGWIQNGSCSTSCGNGTAPAYRVILNQPTNGGKACPLNLTGTTNCTNTTQCPVDCVLSSYVPVTNCSAPCGGGFEVSHADVLQPARNGGSCQQYILQQCNTQACGAPGFYLNCSFSCNGTNTTFFNTTVAYLNTSNFNYSGCSLNCSALPPIDCQVSDWFQVQPCSQPCIPTNCHGYQCLAGSTVQARNITQQPLFGGQACPALWRQVTCGAVSCAAPDYFLNCSISCNSSGNANFTLLNSTSVLATTLQNLTNANCSVFCDVLTPINCVVGPFVDAGPCTVSCGGGYLVQERDVLVPSLFGGIPCPNLVQLAACNTFSCDIVDVPLDCGIVCTEQQSAQFANLSVYNATAVCTSQCNTGLLAAGTVFLRPPTPPIPLTSALLPSQNIDCTAVNCAALIGGVCYNTQFYGLGNEPYCICAPGSFFTYSQMRCVQVSPALTFKIIFNHTLLFTEQVRPRKCHRCVCRGRPTGFAKASG